MKSIRYRNVEQEKTGVILNVKKYDTSAFGDNYVKHFFENDGLSRLASLVEENKSNIAIILDDERLGSPQHGVGLRFSPQIFLKTGEVVELGINGLGEAKQTVISYA